MVFLKRDFYFVKCFFSFSERVKNEAGGENKGFKNYNCVGIYAFYKFQCQKYIHNHVTIV